MPPKKISVGKCLEEQKGCKAFQEMYINRLNNTGETCKREMTTSRPRAGKLLAYGATTRIGDVPTIPKLILNTKTTPPSVKYKKDTPKQAKIREDSSLTSRSKTSKTARSPPKGLLFQATSATTVLQGLKVTTANVLTKKDLQNSIFSQDPNSDGSKTQRILQWLRDCEVARESCGGNQATIYPSMTNLALVDEEEKRPTRPKEVVTVNRNYGVEMSKKGKQCSKLGNVILDKNYIGIGKSLEKRKRSTAEISLGTYEIQSQSKNAGRREVLEAVKKVKNWNTTLSPVLNVNKRQQKIKGQVTTTNYPLVENNLGEEDKGKCLSKMATRNDNFLADWLRKGNQLLSRENLYFEQLKMLRQNLRIPLKKTSLASGNLICRRDSCQVASVTTRSLDVAYKSQHRLKRICFNALLENVVSRKVLETRLSGFYKQKLIRKCFYKWRMSVPKTACSHNHSVHSQLDAKKLQTALDKYRKRLLWNAFLKWKSCLQYDATPRVLRQSSPTPQDKLTEFIIMATSRIRQINKSISPVRRFQESDKQQNSPTDSQSSEKTIANLSHSTRPPSSGRKIFLSSKLSTCSSSKTIKPTPRVVSKSDTKIRHKIRPENILKECEEKAAERKRRWNAIMDKKMKVSGEKLKLQDKTPPKRSNQSLPNTERGRRNVEDERKKLDQTSENDTRLEKEENQAHKGIENPQRNTTECGIDFCKRPNTQDELINAVRLKRKLSALVESQNNNHTTDHSSP